MMKSPEQKESGTLSPSRKVLHDSFEIGIVLKGVDGLFEILGGVLLLFISPDQINRILLFLLRHELTEDPRDLVANFLLKAAGHLSVSSKLFGALYLLSHGVVKAVIVLSLWRNRLWAYPAAIVFFAAFIAYQLYRYTYSHSLWLIVLSIFDVAIVALTWIEYRHVKAARENYGTL